MTSILITWKKTGDGVYEESTGRYRIERHVVDDSWDTGALVRINTQWVRSERVNDEWTPVDLHSTLGDAKQAAERWIARV